MTDKIANEKTARTKEEEARHKEMEYDRKLRRHDTLERQKNDNQFNRDRAIIYISAAGLGFCAYSAKNAGMPYGWFYIFCCLLFALTIHFVVASFTECETIIKKALRDLQENKEETQEDKSVNNVRALWSFRGSILALFVTFVVDFAL